METETVFLFSLVVIVLAVASLNTSKIEKLEKRIKELEKR